MISKQYFEETFSLTTAQALQAWANSNLIATAPGSYAMKVNSNTADQLPIYAETELTGLTIDDSYTVKIYMEDIVSNAFRIFVNALPSDNTSMVAQEGWVSTPAWKEFTFTATETTMYLAIGDEVGYLDTIYSISDSISVTDSQGTNYVTNGDFDLGNTTGWYAQNANTVISLYEYATVPIPPVDNDYLEEVNVPAYNPSNSAHVLINEANGLFTSATFNNASYTSFYIEPGDYTSSIPSITTSGSSASRRYISLYNGNDTHPGQLDKSELAKFSLIFNGASYWTLDRPANFDHGVADSVFEIQSNAHHNIINRMFTNNIKRAVRISYGSNNTTIQNSRFDNANSISDNGCLELVGRSPSWEIKNTKIINNEIKNYVDGIQLVSYNTGNATVINGEGTIIDSNDIYITDELYTDGSGNYDPNGTSAYAENALDFKFGSSNPANPVVVSNNHMWGYRKSDTTGSTLGDSGSCVSAHYGITNLNINDNYIFDSNGGINCTATGGFTYSWSGGEIKRNVLKECGTVVGSPSRNWNIYIYKGEMNIEDNLLFTIRDDFMRYAGNLSGMVVQNNLTMDSPTDWYLDSNSGGTYSYHAANNNGGSYQVVTASSQGYTDDYVFTTDKFTNSPYDVTITNVVKP